MDKAYLTVSRADLADSATKIAISSQIPKNSHRISLTASETGVTLCMMRLRENCRGRRHGLAGTNK
jgi:hypothetical protein